MLYFLYSFFHTDSHIGSPDLEPAWYGFQMSAGAAVPRWRVWLYRESLISFSVAVIKCSGERNSRERGCALAPKLR